MISNQKLREDTMCLDHQTALFQEHPPWRLLRAAIEGLKILKRSSAKRQASERKREEPSTSGKALKNKKGRCGLREDTPRK